MDMLAGLVEDRLGGMMLVRLGLTDVIEHFKKEEHAYINPFLCEQPPNSEFIMSLSKLTRVHLLAGLRLA